jgi:hypothetical protein
MSKADWSNFDETNDYSRTTATAYTDAPAYTGSVVGLVDLSPGLPP